MKNIFSAIGDSFKKLFKRPKPQEGASPPEGLTYSDLAGQAGVETPKEKPKEVLVAKEPRFKKRFIITALFVVVALIILARATTNINKALFKKKPESAKVPAITFEETAPPVKAYKIKKMDFKDTLPSIGNIKGFKEIELKFQTAGIIESFNFEEGEKIQEGDIIASLVQKDALLKLKYAEIESNKNKKLFDIGAISSMKLEQSKLEYESAKSDLDKTNIYAVSNGTLGTKLMDAGSYSTPNDRIGVFVDIDKVYAEFNIIEKDIPKIALGQRTEIFVDAYPTKSFAGVVDRISPIVEGRSRTETIKVELDNKEDILRPGMFVRALIATYEKKDAIVLPTSGMKKKENEYIVYVIHQEEPRPEAEMAEKNPEKQAKGFSFFGKKKEAPKPEAKEKEAEFGAIEVRKIALGYIAQDLVEVEKGLREDELIVIEIQEDYKDKSRVEIMEVQEGLI